MRFSVGWGTHEGYHERALDCPAEILDFVKQLARQLEKPTMVEICGPEEGQAFAIGFGRAQTILTYQPSLDPPYFVSWGGRKQGEIMFYYACEATFFGASNAIPFEQGMEALVSYLETLEMPTNLEWEEL